MTIAKKNKGSYFFSEHAASQLITRSSLIEKDVFLLLEKELYIPVGQDKHRIHTLIHSVRDNHPLVLVYDDRNKEIVTVLYMDYNNKFVISPVVAEEIRTKTVQYHQKINYWKTEWIWFHYNLKTVILDEDVPFYFLVDRGDKPVEIKFYTCKKDMIKNDIHNIQKMPDIRLIIEKCRKKLNIKKEEIISIGIRVPIKTNMITFAGSKPYNNIRDSKKNLQKKATTTAI